MKFAQIKELPGFVASSDGRIWHKKKGRLVEKKSRVIDTRREKNGYLKITIYSDYGSKNFSVSRLVLLAFVGPCPAGYVSCHNDGNKLNNNLENLRWDTVANNNRDKIIHGTSRHPNSIRQLKQFRQKTLAGRNC